MKRNAAVSWSGSAREGHGTFRVGSGALTAPFTYNSRFRGDSKTNPEELLLSALAGCLTLAMAAALQEEKGVSGELETSAELDLVPTSRVVIAYPACGWNSRSPVEDRKTSWIGPCRVPWTCARSATRSRAPLSA